MSIFNDKALKGVAAAVSKIMDEELKGNQHKIDANKNGKVDAHDFKLLRGKKTMKEEDQIDEAFPTVDDAKKRMNAGKTATGSVTKTKTGLVHKRDYKDDDDSEDMQKKSGGYGARQNMGKRGQSDGTKKTMKEAKLSFTEMLHLYNEHGIEVISKIAPQTVKFGDTEVEVIDANIVNGAVGITVAEEVDNETFTKEVEAQKEKNAGRGKKAEVAKPSVQAVKQEEVELDEALQPDKKIGSHTIKHTKSDSTTSYVGSDREKSKHKFHHYDVHDNGGKAVGKIVHEITHRPSGRKEHSFQAKVGSKTFHGDESEHTSVHKFIAPHLKEDVEQIDELSKDTLSMYVKKAHYSGGMADFKHGRIADKRGDSKDKMKLSKISRNRERGINKAVDRLTKKD
jgi:hypothetical protein